MGVIMPNLNVEVNVYGLPKIKRTVQMAAFVVDSFNAIPQVQLMHVIDAARETLPDMCERLDAWLNSLDMITMEIEKFDKDNA